MERLRKDPVQSFRLNPATEQGTAEETKAQGWHSPSKQRSWPGPGGELVHQGRNTRVGREQLLGKGGEGTAAVSQCTHINVSKQHGHEPALTDGAILVFVCLQSCQFRSPGQKSFYLLNHMLCRTKRLADFKAYVF